MGVDGARRRLHEEHVGAADALLVAGVDLAVGERLDEHPPQPDAELAGDALAEGGVAAPGEDHEAFLRGGRAARIRQRAPPWVGSSLGRFYQRWGGLAAVLGLFAATLLA